MSALLVLLVALLWLALAFVLAAALGGAAARGDRQLHELLDRDKRRPGAAGTAPAATHQGSDLDEQPEV